MPALVNPTLLQLNQRTRFFLDEPVQANYQDSDINYAINQAQQDVATEISLVDEQYFVNTTPTVISSVGGQRFYPLNADVWKITRIEDVATGIRLEFESFTDQNNFFTFAPPLITGTDIGYSVSVVGNSIAITPTPSVSGINCQYWYVPQLPDMQANTDTSQIPPQFIDLVSISAALDGFVKDEDDISSLEAKYQKKWNQLIRASRNRQQQNPRHVTRISSPVAGYTL
jgi:hypothetical protein